MAHARSHPLAIVSAVGRVAGGGALIKTGECDLNGKQNALLCQVDLPTTLAAGSYWLAAQYRTPDGTWVTPWPTTVSPNPAPITVR